MKISFPMPSLLEFRKWMWDSTCKGVHIGSMIESVECTELGIQECTQLCCTECRWWY